MRRLWNLAWLVMWALTAVTASPSPALADGPVVHAVLFYSPTCPHCHKVITEDLPPLFEEYGDRLQILGIDVTQSGGQALYQASIRRFDIPADRLGVPTLIVGETVLVGSVEIPQQLPSIIEKLLAQGGVDWPDILGLSEALGTAHPALSPTAAPPTRTATLTVTATPAASRPTPTPLPTLIASPEATMPAVAAVSPSPPPTATAAASGLIVSADPPANLRARMARDPIGNSLAIAVLIGMVFSAGWALIRVGRSGVDPYSSGWVIPVLSVIGLGVAGYLAYVETTQVTAVCGPVGDCNAVQQSEYARLFGVMPIGVLGLAGYLAIMLAWAAGQYAGGNTARLARHAVFVMALLGTLFSIYLAFLEPFVIGATCAWCLASAILVTLTLLFSLGSPDDARAIRADTLER